ncbi:MAG: hypothetical protein WCE58_11750 [Gallionella sp.]
MPELIQPEIGTASLKADQIMRPLKNMLLCHDAQAILPLEKKPNIA